MTDEQADIAAELIDELWEIDVFEAIRLDSHCGRESFFYHFPAQVQDRPYLGCIHPKTGQQLWYLGLPIRSSQSPALGCQYGLECYRFYLSATMSFKGNSGKPVGQQNVLARDTIQNSGQDYSRK
jgi:hypothetical protein